MRFLAVLVVLGSGLAAGPPVVRDPAKTGLDPQRLGRIRVRMKEFVDAGKAAGIVTLVARRGQVAALDAVGYFDMDSKKPMPADAIFQIHSMTKPVVCTAIMMLAEEGKVALNDPVSRYLPEFRGQWVVRSKEASGDVRLGKPSRPITIRDLMTHTSGMSTNPNAPIQELHRELQRPLSEAVLIFSQQPLEFEPGTRWLYSNTGIAALGRIIEVQSGMAFEKFLEQRIFKPLGMVDTYIYPPKEKFHRMPTAYIQRNGWPVKYTDDPLGEGRMKFREGAKYPLPEGGLYSTAADLYELYRTLLDGGTHNGFRLLSRASVEVMTAPHTGELRTSAPGAAWGLGWSVVVQPAGALNLASIGTFGHGGRYGTYCFIDPKKDLIGVFMIHREGGSDERNAFVQMTYAALTE